MSCAVRCLYRSAAISNTRIIRYSTRYSASPGAAKGTQYSKARALSRAAFLRDLAAHAREKSAVVAKQHGHSVEVMLRMYVAWLDGATAADIQAIKQAMERRPAAGGAIPDVRAAISAVNAGTNRGRLIVIRPPESPEFGSSLAVGKDLSDSSLRYDSQKKWRRGWNCSRLRRESSASLRTDACASSKIAARFCRTRVGSSTHPAPPKIEKGLRAGPFLFLAERVGLLAAGDGRSSSASLRTDACASSKIAA